MSQMTPAVVCNRQLSTISCPYSVAESLIPTIQMETAGTS